MIDSTCVRVHQHGATGEKGDSRQRNLVERFFNRIKHFRGIATRYDKCPENYLAAVKLICARIWCTACGGDLGRSGA